MGGFVAQVNLRVRAPDGQRCGAASVLFRHTAGRVASVPQENRAPDSVDSCPARRRLTVRSADRHRPGRRSRSSFATVRTELGRRRGKSRRIGKIGMADETRKLQRIAKRAPLAIAVRSEQAAAMAAKTNAHAGQSECTLAKGRFLARPRVFMRCSIREKIPRDRPGALAAPALLESGASAPLTRGYCRWRTSVPPAQSRVPNLREREYIGWPGGVNMALGHRDRAQTRNSHVMRDVSR